MSTNQVVRILSDSYQNSEYAAAAMSRINEILQMVSFLVSYKYLLPTAHTSIEFVRVVSYVSTCC